VHLRDVAFDHAHGIKIVPKEPGHRSPSYTLRLIRRSVARGKLAAEQAAREAVVPSPPPVPSQDEEPFVPAPIYEGVLPRATGKSPAQRIGDMVASGQAAQARRPRAEGVSEASRSFVLAPAINPAELAPPAQVICECLVHFSIKQKKVQMLGVVVDPVDKSDPRRWYNPVGSTRYLGVSEKDLKKGMKAFLLNGNSEWPLRITKVEFMLSDLDPDGLNVLRFRADV